MKIRNVLSGLGLVLAGNTQAQTNVLENAAAKYNAKIVWVQEGTPLYTVASTFERGNESAWNDNKLSGDELIATTLCDNWMLRGRISSLNNKLADLTAVVATEAGPGFESLAAAMKLDNVLVKLADGTTCSANPKYVTVNNKDGLRGDGAVRLRSQSALYPVAVPNSYFPSATAAVPAVENHAPVIDDIADITVNEGKIVTVNPTATDVDGDVLTYTYKQKPAKSIVINNNLSWTTNSNDAGTYPAKVCVSDGTLEDCTSFNIKVEDVPEAAAVAPVEAPKKSVRNPWDLGSFRLGLMGGVYGRNFNVDHKNVETKDSEHGLYLAPRVTLPLVVFGDEQKWFVFADYDGRFTRVKGDITGSEQSHLIAGGLQYAGEQFGLGAEVGGRLYGRTIDTVDGDVSATTEQVGNGLGARVLFRASGAVVGYNYNNVPLDVIVDGSIEGYGNFSAKASADVRQHEIYGGPLLRTGALEVLPYASVRATNVDVEGDGNVPGQSNSQSRLDVGVQGRYQLSDNWAFNGIVNYAVSEGINPSVNDMHMTTAHGTYDLGVGFTYGPNVKEKE